MSPIATPPTPGSPSGWSARRSLAYVYALIALLAVVTASAVWVDSGFSNPYGQPNVTTENAVAQASGCGGSWYTLTFTFTLVNRGDRAANVELGGRLNGIPEAFASAYAPAHSSVARTAVADLAGPCPVGPMVAEVRVLGVTPS